jgi:hypothetical protein
MECRRLSAVQWRQVWQRLPEGVRDVYSNPDYHDVCAAWVVAQPECLYAGTESKFALYSYLRCAVDESLCDGRSLFDAQTCYGYGGPLFCGEWSTGERIAALAVFGEQLRRTDVVAEFVRCRTEGFSAGELVAADYRVLKVRNNVECGIGVVDGAGIPASWRQKARRVRRAHRAGLSYTVGSAPPRIAQFERLYAMTAQRRAMAGFYRFDLAHFRSLLSVDSDNIQLILVERPGGEVVAGAILFLCGEVAYYHLGASNLDYRELCPSEFLYFAMARVAAERGVTRMIWGGGLGDDPNDSLFRFKSHFGDRIVPVHIACRVIDADSYRQLCARWEAQNPAQAGSAKMFLRYRQ